MLTLRALAFLVVCGCSSLTLAPGDVPASTGKQLASNGLGVNVDPTNPGGDPSPSQLAAAGVRIVRFTFKDGPGALDLYRGKLDGYAAAGIDALVLLDYETVPGFPQGSDDVGAWDAYRAQFTARVGEIAAAYSNRVAAYEIWNEEDEPNPSDTYAPGVPASRYGELLRDAYAAIKAHSTAAVITGGADSGDPGYLATARDAAGGLFADAVGLHPYGQRPDPSWPDASWGFGTLSGIVGNYQARLGLPVWITELGLADDTLEAEYLAHSAARVKGSLSGEVERLIWFCWSDAMVDGFGLVDGDGNPKPAYWEFVAASSPPPPLADVVVTQLTVDPPQPAAGDGVHFVATIKNIGGQPTRDIVGVAFLVDGAYVTWASQGVLDAQEELTFTSVDTWTAASGHHTLTAVADDVNRFPEANENNNSLTVGFDVVDAPPSPRVLRACFSSFTVDGDDTPTVRADLTVTVPAGTWTQPMGTSAASCDWYWSGESFRARYPEIVGAWRVGVDVHGASAARDGSGVDHPWRFALREDGCGADGNIPLEATVGQFTVTGFFKLAPGDEMDVAKYYAGIVQEGTAWTQDGVGCP
jgi:hypothetical protein